MRLLLLLVLAASSASAEYLNLKNRRVHMEHDRLSPISPAKSRRLLKGHDPETAVSTHFVHTTTPVTPALRRQIERETGVTLGQGIEKNLVSFTSSRSQARRLASHRTVGAVFTREAVDKISPAVYEQSSCECTDGKCQTVRGKDCSSAPHAMNMEVTLPQEWQGKKLRLPQQFRSFSQADWRGACQKVQAALESSGYSVESVDPVHFLESTRQVRFSGVKVQDVLPIAQTLANHSNAAMWGLQGADGEVLDPVYWISMVYDTFAHNNWAKFSIQSEKPPATCGGVKPCGADDFKTDYLESKAAMPIWNKLGLQGEGEIIHVLDTGLDLTHCMFHDNEPIGPTHRKIVRYDSSDTRKGNDLRDGQGHGSHCAGTVAGASAEFSAGTNNVDVYAGHAPLAKMAITDANSDLADSSYISPGYDTGVTAFENAYNLAGARVSSNSWGSAAASEYDTNQLNLDTFMYEKDDMLLVWAASNAGPMPYTVGAQGQAKNILTVGAGLNGLDGSSAVASRCPNYGYEAAKTAIYTADNCDDEDAPKDQCARDYDKGCQSSSDLAPRGSETVVNEEGVISFSSTGPTWDERIKPDLIVPGHQIRSAKTHGGYPSPTMTTSAQVFKTPDSSFNVIQTDQQFADLLASEPFTSATGDAFCNDYVASMWHTPGKRCMRDLDCEAAIVVYSGTSMACPAVAGNAGLVREYFVKKHSLTDIPASLIKATLIAGAHNIDGKVVKYSKRTDEALDTTKDVPLGAPNGKEGFGKLKLDSVLTAHASDAPVYHTVTTDAGDFKTHSVVDATTNTHVSAFLPRGNVLEEQKKSVCFRAKAGSTFQATLVWTDPPAGIDTSTRALQNNLDLEVVVIGDSVTSYYGNAPTDGEKAWDSVNNVEKVVLPVAEETLYGVSVFANPNMMGPTKDGADTPDQDYSLVITGHGEMVTGADCVLPDTNAATCEESKCEGTCVNGHCKCSSDKFFGANCEHGKCADAATLTVPATGGEGEEHDNAVTFAAIRTSTMKYVNFLEFEVGPDNACEWTFNSHDPVQMPYIEVVFKRLDGLQEGQFEVTQTNGDVFTYGANDCEPSPACGDGVIQVGSETVLTVYGESGFKIKFIPGSVPGKSWKASAVSMPCKHRCSGYDVGRCKGLGQCECIGGRFGEYCQEMQCATPSMVGVFQYPAASCTIENDPDCCSGIENGACMPLDSSETGIAGYQCKCNGKYGVACEGRALEKKWQWATSAEDHISDRSVSFGETRTVPTNAIGEPKFKYYCKQDEAGAGVSADYDKLCSWDSTAEECPCKSTTHDGCWYKSLWYVGSQDDPTPWWQPPDKGCKFEWECSKADDHTLELEYTNEVFAAAVQIYFAGKAAVPCGEEADPYNQACDHWIAGSQPTWASYVNKVELELTTGKKITIFDVADGDSPDVAPCGGFFEVDMNKPSLRATGLVGDADKDGQYTTAFPTKKVLVTVAHFAYPNIDAVRLAGMGQVCPGDGTCSGHGTCNGAGVCECDTGTLKAFLRNTNEENGPVITRTNPEVTPKTDPDQFFAVHDGTGWGGDEVCSKKTVHCTGTAAAPEMLSTPGDISAWFQSGGRVVPPDRECHWIIDPHIDQNEGESEHQTSSLVKLTFNIPAGHSTAKGFHQEIRVITSPTYDDDSDKCIVRSTNEPDGVGYGERLYANSAACHLAYGSSWSKPFSTCTTENDLKTGFLGCNRCANGAYVRGKGAMNDKCPGNLEAMTQCRSDRKLCKGLDGVPVCSTYKYDEPQCSSQGGYEVKPECTNPGSTTPATVIVPTPVRIVWKSPAWEDMGKIGITDKYAELPEVLSQQGWSISWETTTEQPSITTGSIPMEDDGIEFGGRPKDCPFGKSDAGDGADDSSFEACPEGLHRLQSVFTAKSSYPNEISWELYEGVAPAEQIETAPADPRERDPVAWYCRNQEYGCFDRNNRYPSEGNGMCVPESEDGNYYFVMHDSYGDGWNRGKVMLKWDGKEMAKGLGSTFNSGRHATATVTNAWHNWDPDSGEDDDGSPCKNGGTLYFGVCRCEQGWSGPTCSIASPCSPNPCQHGTPCVEKDSGYVCDCGTNYYGDVCQFRSGCASAPCLPSNTIACVPLGADYKCDCIDGHWGRQCEETFVEPLCHPEDHSYENVMTSPSGTVSTKSYNYPRTLDSLRAGDQMFAVMSKDFQPDVKTLAAKNEQCGWRIVLPEHQRVEITFTHFSISPDVNMERTTDGIAFCGDLSSRVFIGSGSSTDIDGKFCYTGTNTPSTFTSPENTAWVVFQPRGVLKNPDQDYIEFSWKKGGCQAGWSGDDCSQPVADCAPGKNPCKNGGICTANSAGEQICECPHDYTGSQCETYTCADNPNWSFYYRWAEKGEGNSFSAGKVTCDNFKVTEAENPALFAPVYEMCTELGGSHRDACPKTCNTCPDQAWCSDTCSGKGAGLTLRSGNGRCEDGGEGAVNADGVGVDVGCYYGEDCKDCGPRDPNGKHAGKVESSMYGVQQLGQSLEGNGSGELSGGAGVAVGAAIGIGSIAVVMGAMSLIQRRRGGRADFKGMNEGNSMSNLKL